MDKREKGEGQVKVKQRTINSKVSRSRYRSNGRDECMGVGEGYTAPTTTTALLTQTTYDALSRPVTITTGSL